MHLAMDRAEVGNGISPGFFAFQAVELEYYDISINPFYILVHICMCIQDLQPVQLYKCVVAVVVATQYLKYSE